MEKKVETRNSESTVKSPAAKLKRRSLAEVVDVSSEGGYEAGCCTQDCCV